jgi:hypothetical protein
VRRDVDDKRGSNPPSAAHPFPGKVKPYYLAVAVSGACQSPAIALKGMMNFLALHTSQGLGITLADDAVTQ